MPVSKHRRRPKPAAPPSGRPVTPSARHIATIEEVRDAIADPALDFVAKVTLAGVWWFRQLLRKVGDRRPVAASRKDAARAALLLCVAMDGEPGKNDDIAPQIAAMLRPLCPAPRFAEAWEAANRLPPGTVASTAARLVGPAAAAHAPAEGS